MEGWTSIAIRKTTHQELLKRGKKGDSFDDIVRREIGMDPAGKMEDKTG